MGLMLNLFELMEKITLVHERLFGQIVESDVLGEMFFDVFFDVVQKFAVGEIGVGDVFRFVARGRGKS